MTPITDDDLRRWQLRDARRLVALLTDAAKAKLPPLVWEVHPAGALHGKAMQGDPAEQRAAFEAWVNHLGAKRIADAEYSGVVSLMAHVIPEGRTLPEITIAARIILDD